MKITYERKLVLDEKEKAAVIAALNLVEYDKTAQVHKALKCKSVQTSYWSDLVGILKAFTPYPILNTARQSYVGDITTEGWAAYSKLLEILAYLDKQGIITGSGKIADKLDEILDKG